MVDNKNDSYKICEDSVVFGTYSNIETIFDTNSYLKAWYQTRKYLEQKILSINFDEPKNEPKIER